MKCKKEYTNRSADGLKLSGKLVSQCSCFLPQAQFTLGSAVCSPLHAWGGPTADVNSPSTEGLFSPLGVP
jgi:hypothetical protein